MIFSTRHQRALILSLFLSTAVYAQSYPQFDTETCRVLISSSRIYDLGSVKGERSAKRTRAIPPSSEVDEIRFNLCEDLARREGVAENDQCPSGTRACLTTTNQKTGETDRVTSVVQLATSESLQPEFTALSPPNKGLQILFQGASYPPSSSSQKPIPQSFQLSLICSTETSDPVFKSYDNGKAEVEWQTKAGCEFQGDGSSGSDGGSKDEKDNGDANTPEKSVGSGIGWFFLLLLLALAAYFAIGAYYNYSAYGATGMDLIPHRDFWRDVPYLIRDIVSHLCSTIRPNRRSGRGGYIAV